MRNRKVIRMDESLTVRVAWTGTDWDRKTRKLDRCIKPSGEGGIRTPETGFPV